MNFELLIQKLQSTHDILQASAAKSVNITMTIRNWLYGFYIVEFEQKGEDRATYGEKLLPSIEKKLKSDGQKGVSVTNLKIFRQLYMTYTEIGQILPDVIRTISIGQTASDLFPKVSISQTLPDLFGNSPIIQTASEQL